MSDIERAFIFHGHVQGVGFRWKTSSVASQFNVRGWVRNESDGTVRCEMAGTETELEALLAAIESAMPGHVDTCEEAAVLEGTLPPTGFEIRH